MGSSTRRSRLRPARLRVPVVLLGALLTGPVGLVGCADPGSAGPDPDDSASSEPASSAPASTDPDGGTADGAVPFTEVALLSESVAGGRPGPAVVLDGPDAVRKLTAGLDSTRLTARVTDTVARTRVPEDRLLLGAVLAVGCEEPSAVVGVSRSGGTWRLEAAPYLGPEKQCLVAVTTVALVLVDADGDADTGADADAG